jgi:hypothetical protein
VNVLILFVSQKIEIPPGSPPGTVFCETKN